MKLSISILNIHEVTSWVFWMFKSWRHGNIKKLTSWVLWIFMKWPYGYFEYSWGDVGILNTHEVTLWKYSEADVMGILKFIFKITLLNIQNTHDITSRIFENTHDVSLWIILWRHFVNIQNASWLIWIFEWCHEYSWSELTKYRHGNIKSWRHGYFEYSLWHWYF